MPGSAAACRWGEDAAGVLGPCGMGHRVPDSGRPALEKALGGFVAGEAVDFLELKDKKLYSEHAPEMACISKSKALKHYEFGVKASISLTVNLYDGHTLCGVLLRLVMHRVRFFWPWKWSGFGVRNGDLSALRSWVRCFINRTGSQAPDNCMDGISEPTIHQCPKSAAFNRGLCPELLTALNTYSLQPPATACFLPSPSSGRTWYVKCNQLAKGVIKSQSGSIDSDRSGVSDLQGRLRTFAAASAFKA